MTHVYSFVWPTLILTLKCRTLRYWFETSWSHFDSWPLPVGLSSLEWRLSESFYKYKLKHLCTHCAHTFSSQKLRIQIAPIFYPVNHPFKNTFEHTVFCLLWWFDGLQQECHKYIHNITHTLSTCSKSLFIIFFLYFPPTIFFSAENG